jgi:hypothetical protein
MKLTYIPISEFNCQLFLLRLSWKNAKESTRENMLYQTNVSKTTFFKVLEGEISNTDYQYERINNWIKLLYHIENFGDIN